MSYGRPFSHLASASFAGAAAYTRPYFDAADSEWAEPASLLGYAAAPGPLRPAEWQLNVQSTAFAAAPGPLLVPSVVFYEVSAFLAAPGPLRPANVVGTAHPSAVVAAGSPLGSPGPVFLHDFTTKLQSYSPTWYVMDLITPGGPVRVPISSWQGTLQSGQQCYAQCVIPAAQEWVATINTATEFSILRRGLLLDGSAFESEMFRVPVGTATVYPGTENYTATLAGYFAEWPVVEDPPVAQDRTLTDIRTSTRASGTTRVRCAIDWLLRPSQRAYIGAEPIIVAFMNFYATGSDHYVDIGDRAA